MIGFGAKAASTLVLVGAALTIAGCNANSDAVRVLDADNTSLRATIAAYQGIEPTATAQAATLTAKMQQVNDDLATSRAQVNDLTAKMNALQNGSGGQVAASNTTITGGQTGNPGASNPTTDGGTTQPQLPQSDPNAFAIANITTAKGRDKDGCVLNQSNTFSLTDQSIWVIADVRNYKKGTAFAVKWSGDNNFVYSSSWTVPSDGKQICVHFYIEPKTVGLKNGNYTVTMTAGSVSGQAAFTVQDGTTGGTTSGTNAAPTNQNTTSQGQATKTGNTGNTTSDSSGNGSAAVPK